MHGIDVNLTWFLDPAHRRRLVAILFFGTVAGLSVGAFAFLPYLIEEHKRLAPWKIALIWFGDACSLTWFTWYFVSRRWDDASELKAEASRSSGREWRAALVSMLVAVSVDLSTALMLMHEERAAFQTAVRTQGTVHTIRRTGPAETIYVLLCDFNDRDGMRHTARFVVRNQKKKGGLLFVRNRKQGGLPSELPAQVRQAILALRPFQIAVSYEAARPGRSWITALGWDHGDRLHWLSFAVLIFQGSTCALFVLAVFGRINKDGGREWWFDLYMVVPLATEAAFALLFGTLGLLVNNPPR